MLKSLRLKAYAKLNPSLYVGARRFDGFHPLESAAVTVDVADIVTVSQTDSGRIESDYCGGRFYSRANGQRVTRRPYVFSDCIRTL